MRRRIIVTVVATVVLSSVLFQGTAFASEHSATGSASMSSTQSTKAFALREGMRKLWEDHITWTRLFVISALADLPDKEVTTQRLLQNQTDIGDAVKPFYGDAAGNKLAELLKAHIVTAAELVAAAKAKDGAKQQDATKRWYTNADEIAVFLSGANPRNWSAEEMKSMMHEHLDVTTAEVVARLQGDWAKDVAAYTRIHEQILKMADMLSDGIIKQFPTEF